MYFISAALILASLALMVQFSLLCKARRALATKLLRRWRSCQWWHSERALTATEQLLVTFFFQYAMDLTETARVCALLLRIGKVQRKKRRWVHPIVSNRLLTGSFINCMRI
jgi:uncharacterized membrane protein YfbV (UPF0208 family)